MPGGGVLRAHSRTLSVPRRLLWHVTTSGSLYDVAVLRHLEVMWDGVAVEPVGSRRLNRHAPLVYVGILRTGLYIYTYANFMYQLP